jgi:RNA polymerase sigma-70 factor, ECF subfamily
MKSEEHRVPVRQSEDGVSTTAIMTAVAQPLEEVSGLISACQEGDRDAFRRLFELYREKAYTIALYHLGGDETAAEDVVQTVFVKLFRTIRQFRRDSEFATWLYRSIANACMDEHRRRRRWIPWASAPDRGYQPDMSGVEESVRAAIEKLSPKLRMPVLLKYFEDLSYEEIAHVLGCSMGTVASRLNRAHKILAQHLSFMREDSRG